MLALPGVQPADSWHAAGGTTFLATAQPCITGHAKWTQWWALGHADCYSSFTLAHTLNALLRQAAHYYTPCNVDDLRKRAAFPNFHAPLVMQHHLAGSRVSSFCFAQVL